MTGFACLWYLSYWMDVVIFNKLLSQRLFYSRFKVGPEMYREIGQHIIRGWRMEDAPSIAKYANNRKIWMNLRDAFPYPYSLQDAESFISRIIEADPITVFAIATQSEAIGSIGLMVGNDVHRYTAEMGYWLAEPYWGKGIMTKAVKSMTSYAVRNLKLHSGSSTVADQKENLKSFNSLKSLKAT